MEDRSTSSGIDYVKEVGKHIVTEVLLPPLKRHLDYWWSCPDNIQSLKYESSRLKRARRDMDQNLEEARHRAESSTSVVRDWSDECTQKQEETHRIVQGYDELKPWNIISRYQLGKSAKKAADGIAKLRNEVESIRISDPSAPPSMAPIPHEPTMEFESRRRVEEDIIESLKDEHVRMIAVCGPGGVGKTTMVRRIEDMTRKENLFDEIVHVVVSQQADELKIQKEIAELLGLPLIEDTLAARAHKLHIRLVDSKRKLIIFDDVWKSFNLNHLGVPFEKCKIILTSRLRDVCEEMDAHKVVQIKVLDDQESWRLFREKSGVREDDLELRPIAEAVAAECKGLPIALVPIAKALKNKHIHTWEDSLLQLQRANPNNFPKVLEDVYKPLKLSYDFLENESEKSIFLLCCLFPEDDDIPIELLTLYSIGLGILKGIRSIHEGKNRTHHLVERLKSSFLLIDGSEGDEVKMHDVVRDVAIFIGSNEKHGFLKSLQVSSMDSPRLDSSCDCRWMSLDISNVNAELPVGPAFQNLCLLMILEQSYKFCGQINYGDIDFEGMEELKVLCFAGISDSSFSTIPELPKNLKTLLLFDVSMVEDISVVGKLTSLEILCIHSCHNIEELPTDIRRLSRLRSLEMKHCSNLEKLAEGVISSLVRLEELKIAGGFDEWGAKVNGSEERNASLLELESLPNLTCLEIDISDSNWVSQDICLSQQLVRYKIYFTESGYESDDMEYERNIYLYLAGDIAVGNWIQQLVRSTQSLMLKGDGANYFNLAEIKSLKQLSFSDCSTVEFMVDGTNLQTVSLDNFDLPSSCCSGTWISQLCEISVSGCDTIEELFVDEGNRRIIFTELASLSLYDLPSLTTLYRGVESIKFPKLETMEIENLPRLDKVAPMDSDDHCLHFFCNQKVEFSCLKKLTIGKLQDTTNKIWCRLVPNIFFRQLQRLKIYDVNDIRNLFSSSIAENLVNLDYLSIESCQEMIEVVEDNKEICVTSLFPKLTSIFISDLHKLKSFCPWKHALEFPSLLSVAIDDCPGMETFTLGPLSTLNDFELRINDERFEEKDLNGGLRDHFKESKRGDRRGGRRREHRG